MPAVDVSSRAVCGSTDEVHSVGNWTYVQFDPPRNVHEFHKIAKYNCGGSTLSAEYGKDFFCGLTSGKELERAFKQFSWKWEAKHCHLPRFGQEFESLLLTFLQQAEGSKIIFVGDSLAHEQYISLRCLLGDYVLSETDVTFMTTNNVQVEKRNSPYLINRTSLNMAGHIGPTGKAMHTRKNPYLKDKVLNRDIAISRLEDKFTWEAYGVEDGASYADVIGMENVYLILNTGAHWHGNIEGYSSMVLNVLNYLHQNFKGKQVFYRPMHHGHVGCADARGPQAQPDPSQQTFDYNWRVLQHYNEFWKIEIDGMKDKRIMFLDSSMMTEDRPDSHCQGIREDCFHLCLPGVIDYWNILLMSVISYRNNSNVH